MALTGEAAAFYLGALMRQPTFNASRIRRDALTFHGSARVRLGLARACARHMNRAASISPRGRRGTRPAARRATTLRPRAAAAPARPAGPA